jgi:hypothetical protein
MIMSETMAQANHELLLGLNRDATNLLRGIETISQQLLTLTTTVGPALGMCGSCAESWIEAGEDPATPISAAVTVALAEGIGAVPMCMWHFREAKRSRADSQLLLASPVMPQQPGLIVPGR